mmetsp:Transcript_954/g.1646  ORF Transcript_954/g.1646 Transcript_954/m.1646 type:complete len:396 (+) Transcript_954:184-1371(+)
MERLWQCLLIFTLIFSFMLLQYSFYSAYINVVNEREVGQLRENIGGTGSFLRPQWRARAGGAVGTAFVEQQLQDEYEQLDVSHLQTAGAVSLGLVVRAHVGYVALLTSLVWSLQAQSSAEGDLDGAVTLVVVVPTEPGSAAVLRGHLSRYTNCYMLPAALTHGGSGTGVRRQGGKGPGTGPSTGQTVAVLVMDPTTQDYEAQSQVLATLCTETWRQDRLAGGWPSSALDRYCSVNSPVHYHLTDLGVDCLLRLAPHLPALVVTNADNAYLPGFSAAARACLRGEGAGQCGRAGGVDVALVHMLHRAQPLQVRPELGHMDLGCAVIRTSALFSVAHSQLQSREGHGPKRLTFADSLPSPAAPENWHDADFWFVDAILKRRNGRKAAVVDEYLFVHN